MIEVPLSQGMVLGTLFAPMEFTLARSFTQGFMGRGWADDLGHPRCAQIILGVFCMFAGDAQAPGARELVRNLVSSHTPPALLGVCDEHWGALIEREYGTHCGRITRYAIKKEPNCFDPAHLRELAAQLPAGLHLQEIDATLYERTFTQDFSKDFCSQFESAQDYVRRGIGVCAMEGERLVAGASSYSVFERGIEIEIATHPDYRRRGIAAACAAQLILNCLARGIYPSWDAANCESVALAQKLGYHFQGEYPAWLMASKDEKKGE